MALRNLFDKKKVKAAADEAEAKAREEQVLAAAVTPPELDAKMAKVINENVEQSVKQKQKEAESVVKEKKKMADKLKTVINASNGAGKKKLRPEVRPHAFVVMPFGKKKGADGSLYDFNAIYQSLIKPALESSGFEPF